MLALHSVLYEPMKEKIKISPLSWFLLLQAYILYQCSGQTSERNLIHSIESVVIEWCHQVRDVLQKNSAQALLDGKNPGPLVEVEFWKERCADLFFINEQVQFLPSSTVEPLNMGADEKCRGVHISGIHIFECHSHISGVLQCTIS